MLVTQAPQKHLPESSAKAASSGSETESTQLSHPDRFSRRHIGPTAEQITQMLEILRFSDLTAFTEAVVPPRIRLKEPLHLPAARSEYDLLAALKQIASQNQSFRSFIGMGYYDCITPAVIERNILENPSWYTPYTPYQAEIAQGRLEALLNFQSLVIDLTGLEVANASLLDEATAAAEAMIMCHGAKPDGRKFLVSAACHPQVIAVVKTRARALGLELLVEEHEKFEFDDAVFGALVAYPNTYGEIHDYSAIAAKAHGAGALLVVDADLLSLCLLRPPGEFDADIAIGSAQRFGVPLGYGGPHAAYCATRDALKRRMPGRIVGVSKDSRGRPALRLALQTREQHIRREKATSNICTAQALLATMASMYACYHGPVGLKKIAQRIDLLTHLLADGLQRLGHKIGRRSTPNSRPATPIAFFDTIYVDLGSDDAEDILKRAQVRRMNFRQISEHAIGISLDETTALSDVVEILETFNGDRPLGFKVSDVLDTVELAPAHGLLRTTPFLQHSIFNRFHSETEMLRYMKRLESLDLSLTNSMIPLGSCTMKLNAAAEMIPVTWSEFGRIHPFAPSAQVRGYQTLFRQLEDWLAEITGFASVSLQPNAGSQGEYAGLLVISAYHASRGESRRKICLIPSSAHGTNPASAVMAGLKVVSIGCDTEGNIDLADLRAKATQYKNELAALMVTYPSTHGVFEEAIKEICQIIHAAGGLVYMDGANMNAQVGLCRPGEIGADVCHLNLHKTFCIPHGGGGPGMGPIAVAEHLRAFLPDHPVVKLEASTSVGAVSAAPWGSASILIIPWIYIAAMGAEGLTEASQVAILNANYIVRRVEKHFPVLYRGRSGLVAHECILDVRQFRKVTVEDIAKRLMDYGFHAPTISWPVPGTMMIEPTESESKEELDRFCDALLSIHEEIMAIENGKADAQDNVLKNSPHTADSLASDTWRHPYSREQAAYPTKWLHEHKFWPAVGRIDNVYGDRNLVCSCAGMEDY